MASYGIFQIAKNISDKTIHAKTGIMQIGFHDIGELATESCICKEGSFIEDPRKTLLLNLPIPFTTTRAFITCTFEIKAGYDFEKIKINWIDDITKTVNITMPQVRILSNQKLDKDQYCDISEVRESIFNDFSLNESDQVVKEMKEKAEKTAVESGLYEKAQKNAEQQIKNLLYQKDKQLKYYEFKFDFEKGE